MFGLTLIKTSKLRQMKWENTEKSKLIDDYKKDVKRLEQEVKDLTPKRDAGGRFSSAPKADGAK